MTGFAPPYPDLSELLPAREVEARAIVGQPVNDPFDEDDEFAKRWYVSRGRKISADMADWYADSVGPFSSKEADQFIEDLRLVQDVMDR